MKLLKANPYTFKVTKNKLYFTISQYTGNILLIAVNYDKKTKQHECMIEPYHARVFRNEQKHKTAQMNDYKTNHIDN